MAGVVYVKHILLSLQEWGTEEHSEEHGYEGDGGGGGSAAALHFTPKAMRFGASALGAAHSATVTIHNTANSTLHLASVSGSTSDFYASFFDTKVHYTSTILLPAYEYVVLEIEIRAVLAYLVMWIITIHSNILVL